MPSLPRPAAAPRWPPWRTHARSAHEPARGKSKLSGRFGDLNLPCLGLAQRSIKVAEATDKCHSSLPQTKVSQFAEHSSIASERLEAARDSLRPWFCKSSVLAGAPAWGQGTSPVLLVLGSAVLASYFLRFSGLFAALAFACLASVRRPQPLRLQLSMPMLQSPD